MIKVDFYCVTAEKSNGFFSAYDILEIVYINSFRDEICKTTGICDELGKVPDLGNFCFLGQ